MKLFVRMKIYKRKNNFKLMIIELIIFLLIRYIFWELKKITNLKDLTLIIF